MVVERDVRALHQPVRAQRQQLGIAGAGADQEDLAASGGHGSILLDLGSMGVVLAQACAGQAAPRQPQPPLPQPSGAAVGPGAGPAEAGGATSLGLTKMKRKSPGSYST